MLKCPGSVFTAGPSRNVGRKGPDCKMVQASQGWFDIGLSYSERVERLIGITCSCLIGSGGKSVLRGLNKYSLLLLDVAKQTGLTDSAKTDGGMLSK